MSIEDVKKKHEGMLMGIEGVVGVGIAKTAGGRVIQVLVERDTASIRAKVPSTLDGFMVDIVKIGEVAAL